MSEDETRAVATRWYDALDRGDIETALDCLADSVEWDIPKTSDVLPWLGKRFGKAGAIEAFKLREPVVEILVFKLTNLIVSGEFAVGVIYDKSRCKLNGLIFEADVAQVMQVKNGKIIKWKSFVDTVPMVAAFKGDKDMFFNTPSQTIQMASQRE